MTLPGLDLTLLVQAINKNTDELSKLVEVQNQLLTIQRQDIEGQVKDIRDTLENQYRGEITRLEKLIPNHGHTFPFINGPIGGGGLGQAPVGNTDTL